MVGHCSVCGTLVRDDATACSGCGQAFDPDPPAAPLRHARDPPRAVGLAVLGLLLNMVLWPGLGNVVNGRLRGFLQGSVPLAAALLGYVLGGGRAALVFGLMGFLVGWVWAVGTAVRTINDEAEAVARDAAERAVARVVR